MSEDSLRHLQDTIKWNSICMWGSQEEKKGERGRKLFREPGEGNRHSDLGLSESTTRDSY